MIKYIKESFYELRHNVTWPTASELLQTTVIVIIASAMLGLAILLMDITWMFVTKPVR